jgi:hypothetical protein
MAVSRARSAKFFIDTSLQTEQYFTAPWFTGAEMGDFFQCLRERKTMKIHATIRMAEVRGTLYPGNCLTSGWCTIGRNGKIVIQKRYGQ